MENMNNPTTIIEPYRNQTGGTISALRALVLANGYIRDVDQRVVAEFFNISQADVRGIVSFYADLRTHPPAKKIIQVCQAEACQAAGCRALTNTLESQLDIALGESTPDNEIALESVYCLGHCANGPALLIDGVVCTNLSSSDVDSLISDSPGAAPTEIVETNNRLIFNRCGRVDPLDFDGYCADGGFSAEPTSAESVLAELRSSGLRGRGGAGFPAHIKWQTVADQSENQKYIVCNADEGDSGTFADRLIMEGDPFLLIEGMAIAASAVGASKGFIYLRSEYPEAACILTEALQIARHEGALNDIFDIELFIGAGAYICGEETSLLESLEGKRGIVRAKPPLPAIEGLFGKPTLVHNVITLCSVPWIIKNGGDAYRQLGVGDSTGTMPFQLSGNVKRGGLVELPFGMPLGEFIETYGGGTRSGRPMKAVQVGGPLGAYLSVEQLNTPLTYEAMAAIGAGIGHGGIVVFDDTVDLIEQARYAFAFCEHESCGKCTPCRIGSVRGRELIEDIQARGCTKEKLILVKDLCEVMEKTSLCQMGGMTPIPVTSAIRHFPGDFGPEQ